MVRPSSSVSAQSVPTAYAANSQLCGVEFHWSFFRLNIWLNIFCNTYELFAITECSGKCWIFGKTQNIWHVLFHTEYSVRLNTKKTVWLNNTCNICYPNSLDKKSIALFSVQPLYICCICCIFALEVYPLCGYVYLIKLLWPVAVGYPTFAIQCWS